MEEIEVPTEHLHEAINEKAGEKHKEQREAWTLYLAISTALMAVFAALGSLFAGHHSNEALIAQIKASDTWAHYQAKGIKYQITDLKYELKGEKGDAEKLDTYKKEQEELKKEAEKSTHESEYHLTHHVTLARSVTIFQICIAVSAIAMLTGRKGLWYASMGFSVIGFVLFIIGMA